MDSQPPIIPLVPPAKRRPLIIRLLNRLAISCLVLTLLAPIFYLVEKARGRAAWQAYEADAKARGVKLKLTDFIPASVPDDENFASIPIFAAAFRAAEAKQEPPNPFKLPRGPDGKLPALADVVKQERIDLVAWQKYFIETRVIPAAGDNAAADVLKALEFFAAPLAQLRQAAARPHCRFPVHWEKPAAEFPYTPILQKATNVLALRIAAHLALGESEAAYTDLRDGWQLAAAIRKEPTLIPALTRQGMDWQMKMALWNGLASHQWKEPELRKIESNLATLNWLEDYFFGMSSARAEANQLFDMIIERSPVLDDAMFEGRINWRHIVQPIPTGWFYQNKLRLNRYHDEMAARIDPATHRAFPARDMPSSPVNLTKTTQPVIGFAQVMYYRFFILQTRILGGIENGFVFAASVTDHARIACALERFRLARGSYPDALAGLVPEFLPAIPVEIVNGEPYRYRRNDDGNFVLYSVGTDLRDDGGVIDPQMKSYKQADWIWSYPAK